MRTTKKLTLSAIMTALSAVLLAVGTLLQIADLAMAAMASLISVFVFIEIGSPYTWLVWLATSLLTFLFFPGDFSFITYFLIFGIYPMLKAYIEKLPRWLWWLLKIVYFNVALLGLILCSEYVFGLPLFAVEAMWMKIGLYILCNGAFLLYDVFLTVMIRAYFQRFRSRFSKFLK